MPTLQVGAIAAALLCANAFAQSVGAKLDTS
jgi:hypothetical protein